MFKMRKDFLYICFLFVLLTNCERSTSTSNTPSPAISPGPSLKNSSAHPKREAGSAGFDVCALLTRHEIETELGSPIKETNSSERRSGDLRISQCVYVTERADQSVSLVVTQRDSAHGGKQTARDFWEKTFHRYRGTSENENKEKEEAAGSAFKKMESAEDEEGRPPRKIEGSGDEAFWTAGSLYVLSGDAFIRLSIGGAEAEETKLQHSKALAARVLQRL